MLGLGALDVEGNALGGLIEHLENLLEFFSGDQIDRGSAAGRN